MAEMTKKEFLELLNEFSERTLDPKFKQIDSRFERVDSRFTEFREDITHQFHIISEDLISKVKLVAEGVASLNEKLDRHIDEDRREHQEILAAIKFSYGRTR
jgi:archaellum component FlaC